MDKIIVKNEHENLEADSIETDIESPHEDIEEKQNVNSVFKEKPLTTQTIDIKTEDADVWLGDPFEDPDYIGTPCGDYINGRCMSHNHHKNDLHEDPEKELDSLNRVNN